MKIKRYAYERVTYLYELDLNDSYVAELNELINDEIVYDADKVELTLSDIVAIFNDDYDEKFNREVEFKYRWESENTYTSCVADFIQDAINDDIWECDSEWVDGETDDYETYLEEN